MAVEKYEPRRPSILHAALWRGELSDFADMPNFNRLVNLVLSIDNDGVLIISSDDGRDTRLDVGRDYLVRGVTGHFFGVEKGEFEKTYQPIVEVEEPWL